VANPGLALAQLCGPVSTSNKLQSDKSFATLFPGYLIFNNPNGREQHHPTGTAVAILRRQIYEHHQ